ncbi:23S rRNA m(5)U-1939 methyltransferase [Amycolatopsis sulphurea]|uniref:23S rRNA m(5)U-1939 methyltransferase n=1 Tax=Amycolatopsis sulphurea TaxID=76022 RepID=A0A2A9G0R2_9PSEU|nr:class I SAM-dependent RNA methyltransferase [Amycolatopsis sulphurea]PFG56536.1 23S rRNA m(5)U-1939 methyltransferase [Amycolatopsis sulphurea]
MSENWLGRTLELEIGPVAHGGHCVSRVDGRVVFVRHGLPGERVRAEVTEDKGGAFCRADALEVLTASAHRVTPPCPLAAPGGCGGCDWQHADPGYQRELKAAVVAEQLQRLAGISREVVVEPLDGGPLGWRTRVRLVAGRDGRAGLRAHHSHRVIPLDDCPITVPGALAQPLSKRWKPGTELEVTSDGDSRVHVRELSTVHGRTRGRQLSGGEAVQHAADRDWRLDAHGFWQGHPLAADTFARLVAKWAEVPQGGVAWDLYAGVGLFASVLAEQAGPEGLVYAVESGRRAVSDGERNLADLPQVRWQAGRVEHVLADAPKPVDVVVLDPPRRGAGRAVADAVAEGEPDRIVYVACDPAALARDVAYFAEHGYSLTELRAFDAFPMTHHVECVALLQ